MWGIINIILFENIIFISEIVKHMSHRRCRNIWAFSSMTLKQTDYSHIAINYWKKVILIIHSTFIFNKLFLLLFNFRIMVRVFFNFSSSNIIWKIFIKMRKVFLVFDDIFWLNPTMDANEFLTMSKKLFGIIWVKMRTNIFLQKKRLINKKELSWL